MCSADPFDGEFLLRKEILSDALNRMNFFLFVIWLVKSINKWLKGICPCDHDLSIYQKIPVAAFTFLFAITVGYPGLTLFTYFWTCSYYPWTTAVILLYLEKSFIISSAQQMIEFWKKYDIIPQEMAADYLRSDEVQIIDQSINMEHEINEEPEINEDLEINEEQENIEIPEGEAEQQARRRRRRRNQNIWCRPTRRKRRAQ